MKQNEGRCRRLRGSMLGLSKGQNLTPKAGRYIATIRRTSVEVGQYLYEFCAASSEVNKGT